MSYTPTLDPIFTGNVRVPTATAGDNGQRAASTAFVSTAVSDAIAGIDLSNFVTLDGAETISGVKTHTAKIQANGGIESDGAAGGYFYMYGGGDVYVQTTSAGSQAFAGQVAGDTQDRFKIRGDGGFLWGSGSAAQDVELSRIAANVLSLGAGDYLRAAAAPVTGDDLANKAYVDSVASGLQLKESVRAASTGNLDLDGLETVDGVVLVAGDRVLVKDQTAGADNGIYVVAAGAWARAADLDEPSELTSGIFTFVEEGTTNGDTGWVVTTNNPIVLGTDPVTWTQFSGAGQIVAGAGLTKSGNTLAVGQGTGISVNADDVAVDTSYVMTLGTNQTVTGTKTFTSDVLLTGDTSIDATASATTEPVVRAKVSGDANWRAIFRANGEISFGDGTTLDTNLYRSAADTLKTDDSFVVGTDLTVQGNATFDGSLVALANGAFIENTSANGTDLFFTSWVTGANPRFQISADGTQSWGDGTNAVDTNLYRHSAGWLRTNSSLAVDGELAANGGAVVINGTSTDTLGVSGKASFSGGVNYLTDTVDANYTADVATDHIILVDTAAAAGGVTITLPATHANGDTLVVKDAGGQAETKNITIDPADADTIDGQASCVVNINYMGVTLVSNGTNWFLV